MKRFLTIQGGGIRGVAAAVMLCELERKIKAKCGRTIPQVYDAIGGTSTGALCAVALSTGMSAEDLLQVYLKEGPKIFPYRSFVSLDRIKLLLKYGLSAPKFESDPLVAAVSNIVTRDGRAKQFLTKFFCVSYDTASSKTIVFRSWDYNDSDTHTSRWEPERLQTAEQITNAVVGSCSAPVFFPPRKYGNRSLIDGGVTANDPSPIGITYALRMGYTIEDLMIMSIGTGIVLESIPYEKARKFGAAEWLPYLSRILIGGNEALSSFISRQFARDRMFWLDFVLKRASTALDNASNENIKNLIEEAKEYVQTEEAQRRLDAHVDQVCSVYVRKG